MRVLILICLIIVIFTHKFCFLDIDDDTQINEILSNGYTYNNNIRIDNFNNIEDCDLFNLDNETIPIVFTNFSIIYQQYTNFSNFSDDVKFLLLYSYALKTNESFLDVCKTMKNSGIDLTGPAIKNSSVWFNIYAIDAMCSTVTTFPWIVNIFSKYTILDLKKKLNISSIPYAANDYPSPSVSSTFSAATTTKTKYNAVDMGVDIAYKFMRLANPPQYITKSIYDDYIKASTYVKFCYEPVRPLNQNLFKKIKSLIDNIKIIRVTSKKYYWSGRLPTQNSTLVWYNPADLIGNYLTNRVVWVSEGFLGTSSRNRSGCVWGAPYWEVNDTCSPTILALIPIGWLNTLDGIVCVPDTNWYTMLITAYTFVFDLLLYSTFDTEIFFCSLLNVYNWQLVLIIGIIGVFLLILLTFVCIITVAIFQVHVKD
jgi:hypothetical protein